jgi:hypothetical protein
MKLFTCLLLVVGLITVSSCSKKGTEEPGSGNLKEEMVMLTIDTNGTSSTPPTMMKSNKATRIYYKHPGKDSESWLFYLGFDGDNYISMTLPNLNKETHVINEFYPSSKSGTVALNGLYYQTTRNRNVPGKPPGTFTIESVSDSIVSGSFDFIATRYNRGDTALASYKLKGSFVAKRENWDVIAK